MISIIIPTLNEEYFLAKILGVIKKQEYKDYEVIVADAGSQDKTCKIAADFGCRLVNGRHFANPAEGRNEGAKIAKGELLLFMDVDTIYLPPRFLANAAEEFKKRGFGIAVFPVVIHGNRFDILLWRLYNFFVVKLTQKFLPHISAGGICMALKKVHETIGGFDETVKIAEDMDYVRRAAKVSSFGFVDTEPLLTSARRLESDGRLKTYLKYFLTEPYMLIFGPIKSDIFRYKFGHYKDKR